MSGVAGITVERAIGGRPIFGRVDFRKHPDMLSVFEAKGVEVQKSPYDKEFVEKIKSQEGKQGVKIDVEDLWK